MAKSDKYLAEVGRLRPAGAARLAGFKPEDTGDSVVLEEIRIPIDFPYSLNLGSHLRTGATPTILF